MRRLILCCFLIAALSSSAKVGVFGEYDFSKGGYTFLGCQSESDHSTLAYSMGAYFYTDDINLLKTFQQEWVFSKPGKKYACGYHYTIYLCKNGVALESMRVNLNCNEIVCNEGYFYFEANKLRMFYGKMKRASMKEYEFKNISDARRNRDSVLKQQSLIMVNTPEWVKYEGSFQFEDSFRNCPKCYLNTEEVLARYEKEIKTAYPGEPFTLEERGGSMWDILVEVKCNASLEKKFNLYPRAMGYFGKWQPFKLRLYTFWEQGKK